MKTVLVTAIAGDIAQAIAAIIRETFPDWRLIGMDVHDRHGGGLFVGKLYRAPRAADPRYEEWLNDLIHQEHVDFCIPMSEAELLQLTQYQTGGLGGATLIMANARAIDVGSDKLATSRFLASIGCATPWTIPAEEFDGTGHLPCIFKPRRSAGSKAIFVCRNAGEVSFYRDRYPAAVLQELLLPDDHEVTCAIFRDKAGRTAVLQLLRTLVGGFTGWAQVVEEPEILAQCTRIAEQLDLSGSINAQLRVTRDGPRIFEINPRFSSTALIRHRMGFQDVVWSLQEALGMPVKFHHPSAGTTAVRVQGAVVLGGGAQVS